MALNSLNITTEDIEESKWETCLTEAKEKKCFSYVPVFNLKRVEAENQEKKKRAAIFQLFASIAALGFRSDEPKDPFVYSKSGPGRRSAILEDLQEENLALLTCFYQTIADDEMRARIADILWVSKRDHTAARTAIDAYLQSSKTLHSEADWFDSYSRIERAAYIGALLKGEARLVAIAFVEELLEEAKVALKLSGLPAKLMTLLLSVQYTESKKYAALAEAYGERSLIAQEWTLARNYFDTFARYLSLEKPKDEQAIRRARLKVAETFVQEAEAAKGRSYNVASQFLVRAVEAYRRARGERTRIDELHRLLLDYQKKGMVELKTISTTIDMSEIVAQAKAHVQGKSLSEAILALCTVAMPPKVSVLRKQVEESSEKFLFMSLFPMAIVNNEGKVIERYGSIRASDLDGDEDPVTCHMYANAKYYQNIAAGSAIIPAREEIWNTHPISYADIIPLVKDNPFVPYGREYIFIRGLHAGFSGDFALSLHLLMPQVENSIRSIMAARGVIVSSLKDGKQQEKDLNVLLREPEAKTIFCEDSLFELRGLLISRFGSNLRNLMAHGLLSSEDCYSSQSIYFWWLTLRYVCHPYLLASMDDLNQHDVSDEPLHGGEADQ